MQKKTFFFIVFGLNFQSKNTFLLIFALKIWIWTPKMNFSKMMFRSPYDPYLRMQSQKTIFNPKTHIFFIFQSKNTFLLIFALKMQIWSPKMDFSKMMFRSLYDHFLSIYSQNTFLLSFIPKVWIGSLKNVVFNSKMLRISCFFLIFYS